MTLYISASRNICKRFSRNLSFSVANFRNTNINQRALTLEVDSLDDFTTQLLQKKAEKWTAKNSIHVKEGSYIKNNLDEAIFHLNHSKVNNLFQEAIEDENYCKVLELIEQCIKEDICPSVSNLLYTLELCSGTGNITTIKNIQNFCVKINPEVLKSHSNFQHYIAQATWNKGNVQQALHLFKEVYRENSYLRHRIDLMLRNLVSSITCTRSEAVLISVTKFAEDIAREYKNFYILTCIWQVCFLSEWYTDQCLALDLMNKHSELGKMVVTRIPYVVAVSLQNHKTEAVYRLLEILLKFEMQLQYGGVLLALLDYQIHQKDIRRCIEIIKWAQENNVHLPAIHNHKYMKMLISYSENMPPVKTPVKFSKIITHFKF